jgi:hypothetical protein
LTKLFITGAQYPPHNDIERIANYQRYRKIFDGKQAEVYERASDILKDTPHAAQLRTLYIAVNLIDILVSKPADLMVGDPPSYETGKPDASSEQVALNRIVEENDLNQLVHEVVIGAGIRGDAWIKTYYAQRHDTSEAEALGYVNTSANEPIIEGVSAVNVFPELTRGSHKRFNAVNIASVEWIDNGIEDIPYLNVERHLAGLIVYERFRLSVSDVDNTYLTPISVYTIGDQVATGRDEDVIETGVPRILVSHIPYKTVDDAWQGIGGIQKLESVLAAINDRLVQIDFVLWKHSDPTAYGPDIDVGTDGSVRFGGKYIPVSKDDATPGYMVWNSQLEGAFKELDILIGIVFQMSETPQWLFGTTLASDKGGTGTSHTDGGAIKARFMPILSKVKRIRNHVDRAIRDSLWMAMLLENFANRGVDGYKPYEAVYPVINWRDGIPTDDKAEAEIYAIRTGGKSTIDVMSAIKRMDGADDMKAAEIITRIDADEVRVNGTVDSSVFNNGG